MVTIVIRTKLVKSASEDVGGVSVFNYVVLSTSLDMPRETNYYRCQRELKSLNENSYGNWEIPMGSE